MPAAALAAVRTAAFAACLVLGLASCKMDMDDSAGGGRLAFYIDRATAYNLNFAGGRIIDGSGDGARAASDFNGLTLEAAAAGTITITNPWTTLKYTINGGALTAVPSDGRLLRIRQRDEPGHAERGRLSHRSFLQSRWRKAAMAVCSRTAQV